MTKKETIEFINRFYLVKGLYEVVLNMNLNKVEGNENYDEQGENGAH
jgi:hypothetical protein